MGQRAKNARTTLSDFVDSLSYRSIILSWFGLVIISACIYKILDTIPGSGPIELASSKTVVGWWDTLYYSVITATATGYGDIVPLGWARPFAAAESALGLLLFGVFASKILSRRQDIALSEIHQISFQSAFRNAREDLYLARKDLDVCIARANERHELNEDDMERLAIALQQITHQLPELPYFYEEGSDLYLIDERREALLIESMSRTFSRLSYLLETLHEQRIEIPSEVQAGLVELHDEAQKTTKTLVILSPHKNRDGFSKLDEAISKSSRLDRNT